MRALPFGKFHTILIVIHVILYISSSFTIYNMGFLQMIPAYQCSVPQTGNSSSPLVFQSCTREEMCLLKEQQASNNQDPDILQRRAIPDWSQTRSLQNWITWLDLDCVSGVTIGLFGTLYFAGFLISSLAFSPMSDKYGRKIVFLIGGIAQIGTFLGMLLFKTLNA